MSQPSEADNKTNNNDKTNGKSGSGGSVNKNVIIIAAAVVVIVVAVCITAFAMSRNKQEADTSGLTIGYATEASVFTDQDALQAAIDEARENAANNRITLNYKNNAYSEDGKTFSCFLANSKSNLYDLFFTIFADPEMTDQVLLSGLVRPGSGFEEITLDRALETGDHTMYIVQTMVDTDEEGNQVIKAQTAFTVEFHVTE